MPKGSWHDLPSGLNDNFEMEITHSQFGTLERYDDNSGNPMPLLIWDYDCPEHEPEFPVIWSCGSGWEIRDEGRIVKHPKRDKFIRTSIMGRMVVRVVDELKVEVDELGETWEADLWVGLKFLMKREKLTFPGMEQRGMRGETERLMPIKFLGDEQGRLDRQGRYQPNPRPAPAARGGEPRARARRTTAPTETPDASVTPPTDNPLIKKLATLALNTDTHGAFSNLTLKLPEMMDDANGALLSEVLDSGPGGFWEVTRAGKDFPF